MSSNVQKMRDALADTQDLLKHFTRHGGLLADAFALHMRDNDAALALPLRNCDIGTPAEQTMRFQKFCHLVRTHSCDCSNNCQFINEPDIIHCQFAWAQMPYKKGGAK